MKKRMLLCVCLCFALLLSGCSPYYIGNKPDYKVAREQGDIVYNSYLIHKNAIGFVSVYKISMDIEDSGTILAFSGVSFDKPKTHFTMLFAYEGMSLPQLVAMLGMPDSLHGSGLLRLRYEVGNGYSYDFFFGEHGVPLGSWSIEDPEGNCLTEEDAAVFQWKIRLIYLGIAAALGVVLVVLIKVPKVIRKRKAMPQPD